MKEWQDVKILPSLQQKRVYSHLQFPFFSMVVQGKDDKFEIWEQAKVTEKTEKQLREFPTALPLSSLILISKFS